MVTTRLVAVRNAILGPRLEVLLIQGDNGVPQRLEFTDSDEELIDQVLCAIEPALGSMRRLHVRDLGLGNGLEDRCTPFPEGVGAGDVGVVVFFERVGNVGAADGDPGREEVTATEFGAGR